MRVTNSSLISVDVYMHSVDFIAPTTRVQLTPTSWTTDSQIRPGSTM